MSILEKFCDLIYQRIPLEIEIRRNFEAVNRYQHQLNIMDEEWLQAGSLCCPSCMFGKKYTYFVEKISKAKLTLENLKKKQKK